MTVVYNTDCMDYMKTLPDNAFDLAVVDPPYGIDVGNMKMGLGNTARCCKKENRLWHGGNWDKAPPPYKYWNELFRVSKAQVIWGGNYFALPPCRCFLVWDKGNSFYGRTFSECEQAWTSFDTGAKIFKLSPVDKMRIHPTQTPMALYKWILGLFAQKGMRILDTHVGSGSSRIACYDAGLDFVGCEIDKGYFEAQEERFRVHTAQNELFAQSDMFTGGVK